MSSDTSWTKPVAEPVPRTALRPAEAAESVGVSARTMSDWAKRPDFPLIRIGGVRLVPLDMLKEWLRSQAETTAPEQS